MCEKYQTTNSGLSSVCDISFTSTSPVLPILTV